MSAQADITDIARAIYAAMYPARQWPDGWRARFTYRIASDRGSMISGRCEHSRRRVLLSYSHTLRHPDPSWNHDVLATLVHELLHMAGHTHDEGTSRSLKRYDRLVDRALVRVWSAAA